MTVLQSLASSGGKGLFGLVLQFQTVHQEEDAAGVLGAEKELDDCRSHQSLPGAGGHLKKKTVLAFLHRGLQRVDCFLW